MRSLIENAGNRMQSFLQQREQLVQLLQVNDAYAVVLLQMLSDLDENNESDLFFVYPGDFVDSDQYARNLLAQYEQDWARYAQTLEELGKPIPTPPDFPGMAATEGGPASTIRAVLASARQLLPDGPGHVFIMAFFSLEIADDNAYATLLREVVDLGPADPLFRTSRVVVRIPDPAGDSWGRFPSKEPLWIERCHLDFSQQAIEQSYRDVADDESQPMDDRIEALLSDAVFDYGHGRTEAALNKLDVVLGHYQTTKNHLMQAKVMTLLGDLYRHRLNDADKAGYWYECATVPAAECKAPMALFSPARNLGELAFEAADAKNAEAWFGHAETLARHIPDPGNTIDMMEWRGRALERLGDVDGAIESWEGAKTLATSLGFEGVDSRMDEHIGRVRAC